MANLSRGIAAGACSAAVPGLGQLVTGQVDKAVGILGCVALLGASVLGAVPLARTPAIGVFVLVYVYAIVDAVRAGAGRGATSRGCPPVRAMSGQTGPGHR